MSLVWLDGAKVGADLFGSLAGDLHLWLVNLDQASGVRQSLMRHLSAAELQRCRRYVHQRLRNRNAVARGVLRDILARYVGVDPAQLEFEYGEHGKPALSTGGVSFNLSHSGGWAVVAVINEGAVGVDIEVLRNDLDVEALAQRYFHPREAEMVVSEQGEARRRMFFRCWTVKESYLKMVGVGLSGSLGGVGVDLKNTSKQRVMVSGSLGGANVESLVFHCDGEEVCMAPFRSTVCIV